eukprot:COSAG01_NODE_2029_length_8590_cov_5.719501_10_plen_63_part_00
MRAISEIFNGVMTVKSFSWERPFVQRVASLREAEGRHILRGQRVKGAPPTEILLTEIYLPFH